MYFVQVEPDKVLPIGQVFKAIASMLWPKTQADPLKAALAGHLTFATAGALLTLVQLSVDPAPVASVPAGQLYAPVAAYKPSLGLKQLLPLTVFPTGQEYVVTTGSLVVITQLLPERVPVLHEYVGVAAVVVTAVQVAPISACPAGQEYFFA